LSELELRRVGPAGTFGEPVSRILRPALLCMMLVGCSSPPPSPFVHPRVPHRAETAAHKQPSSAPAVPSLPAVLLTSVPAGTYGPYVGERRDGVLFVWAAAQPDDPKHRRAWYTAAFDGTRLEGPPERVADAPAEVGLCAVKPAGGPNPFDDAKPNAVQAPGFVVLNTRVQSGFQQVEDFVLDVQGELRGGPTELNVPSGDVLWVDAVPTARGTIALWAVRRETSADLYAVALGLDGEKLGDPQKVLGHARAWQAARTHDGVAIAAVASSSSASGAGPVKMVFLDDRAHARAPITVSSSPSADLDLDMVAVKDQLVLAWSDEREIEPRLYTAALDDRGHVTHAAAPATHAVGEQTLVKLVAPPDPGGTAYAAWENLAERPRGGDRVIELASVDSSGTLGAARGAFSMAESAGSAPEMKATAQGLSALTLAPACRAGKPCDGAPELPTFVQFDPSFHVTAAEPVRLDALGGKGASLAWGLSCRDATCSVLAAQATSPAPVYVVDASHHTVDWTAPAWRVVPQAPPRAASNRAIGAIDSVSDLAACRVGVGTLAAWVSRFDPATPDERLQRPAPDGRFEPLRAKLELRAVADDGSLAPVRTISLRARSPGGVSLAPGDPARGDALLAWSALDHETPEVFLTLLDQGGNKLAQHMLTHGKHDVSDVVTAYVGDGWLVAWIDAAHGDPEIYVTKVNRRLAHVVPERRIKTTAGAKSGLVMIAHGKDAELAWANAKAGEVFEARVSGKGAEQLGGEQRVAASAAAVASLALSPYGRGTVVGWVTPSDAQASSVHLALLDPDGRVVGAPANVSNSSGADAVAVSCPDDRCRVVVAQSGELQGFEWSPNQKQAKPVRLTRLLGPQNERVLPVLLGSDSYFVDRAHDGARVRQMRIAWR
jgi:hypothetical protein